MSVAANWLRVQERIAVATEQRRCTMGDTSGAAVRVVAATKGRSAQELVEALNAGLSCFGENYAQEALGKQEELREKAKVPIEWHFIGSLQTNKAKAIVGRFALIESVDRLSLLEEVDRRAREKDITQDILLEVNLAGESSKAGCRPNDIPRLLEAAVHSPNLRIRGLMALPPQTESQSEARTYFAELFALRERWRRELLQTGGGRHDLIELSMGTSSDFEAAILEGATLVRLGVVLFGPRPSGPRTPGAGSFGEKENG